MKVKKGDKNDQVPVVEVFHEGKWIKKEKYLKIVEGKI